MIEGSTLSLGRILSLIRGPTSDAICLMVSDSITYASDMIWENWRINITCSRLFLGCNYRQRGFSDWSWKDMAYYRELSLYSAASTKPVRWQYLWNGSRIEIMDTMFFNSVFQIPKEKMRSKNFVRKLNFVWKRYVQNVNYSWCLFIDTKNNSHSKEDVWKEKIFPVSGSLLAITDC